jgi:hypothetical protein
MTAKTNTERGKEYRARKAAAQLVEVRGIFAPAAAHPAIKAAAVKLSASPLPEHLVCVVDLRMPERQADGGVLMRDPVTHTAWTPDGKKLLARQGVVRRRTDPEGSS